MIVSMIQLVVEMPGVTSIKEKRQIVNSFKDKLIRRFKVSAAEVDLQESQAYAQLGAALVSNSTAYGESVMQKILRFAEDEIPGRLHDVSIHSESYY